MSPSSPEEWAEVARARAADADAMLPDRGRSVGPVYMAGYSIECLLKAYLQKIGKPFPTSGGAGHDVRGLWAASGFRLVDLCDVNGERSFFIEQWSTSLRYAPDNILPLACDELVAGAKLVSGWLHNKLRRARSRR